MATEELISSFLGINPKSLSKREKLILEADLFISICNEIKEIFRYQYKGYLKLINFNNEMESAMLDLNYICLAIKDILLTGEYTLSGIAYYTQTPEDIVYEVVIGSNLRPSAIFLHRVIQLHQEVKKDLYTTIRKKIVDKYLS